MLLASDLVDFHTHSTWSDGADTPEQLVRHAAEEGIRALALTDHDNMDGLESFLLACHSHDVVGIPGVEVSVKLMDFRMHILGLGLRQNEGWENLAVLLAQARTWREERNLEMVEAFKRLGITMELSEVLEEAGDGVLARPHFARVLVKRGVVHSIPEAFDRYLRKGGPGYVPKRKLDASAVVEALKGAGGLVIVAHPVSMIEGTSVLLEEALGIAMDLGVNGYEAFHPDVPQTTRRRIVRFSQTNDMLVSGGSDYHGGNKPMSFLGRASGSRPIWARDIWLLVERLAENGVLDI